MVSDTLKLTGKLKVEKYNQDNNLVDSREIPNLVVSAGKSHIATRISSNSEVIMNHMAIGDTATTPTASDSALAGEQADARVALTSTSVTANTITYLATFPPGTGTGTVQEAGIFNAQGANAGTMLCRTTFASITKGASDSIVITWNVSVA